MESLYAIELRKITKTYGKEKQVAVDEVSFHVNKGELFGLIGPDGAGKTSIFRILTTLLLAEQGEAWVEGFEVRHEYREIRKIAGYMPGKFSLYPDLTVAENLNFFATVFDTTVAENYELIKDIYIQIEPFKDRRAGKLSGGMKQKLALCCALIHRPRVLFLDEPTTGVDPVSRKEFWEMLKKLKMQGITIIVSTPYMDEASLCDRIALIQYGKILSVDTAENMVKNYPEQLYAVKSNQMYLLLKSLRKYPEVLDCYAFGEYAHVAFKNAFEAAPLEAYLRKEGLSEIEMKAVEASIEDCFIKLLKS
ncbi:ABC-type multidrug transport system, ATPase component [Pedobacter steynii]|uniref:ABC-type multidrug transport system, ATPase component n=1 Tax=Pedobacter steynii TaxID=430522 RepID=A0A1H0AAY4_9SPHI|nr:ABC transporter ATP-binding protein [Pedobacter steynii]NQX41409.1 ABC transporter ATP-binding protein [Pedobacter steynii]SDN30798.1 ABC-type multidrug transport system, ATPase component [Pedobacter steynii]